MWFHIEEWIVRISVLLFAITIHEFSHGKAAYSLGDPTPKYAGRLTWNPLRHIDPLGAICLFFFNFGWARPVPVNTRLFKDPRRDTILMALSGPVANLAAAFLAGLFMRYFFFPLTIYLHVLLYMILMNLGLALFNLIPLPPLDGSHVLENVLPPAAADRFRRWGRYGPFVLLGVVMLDNFAHTGILSSILVSPILRLAYLFGGDNFFRLLKVL